MQVSPGLAPAFNPETRQSWIDDDDDDGGDDDGGDDDDDGDDDDYLQESCEQEAGLLPDERTFVSEVSRDASNVRVNDSCIPFDGCDNLHLLV